MLVLARIMFARYFNYFMYMICMISLNVCYALCCVQCVTHSMCNLKNVRRNVIKSDMHTMMRCEFHIHVIQSEDISNKI